MTIFAKNSYFMLKYTINDVEYFFWKSSGKRYQTLKQCKARKIQDKT